MRTRSKDGAIKYRQATIALVCIDCVRIDPDRPAAIRTSTNNAAVNAGR